MNEINPDLSCTKANKGVSTSATNQLSSSKQSSPLASMCPSVTVCDDRTSCILGELNKIYEERLADIDEQTNGNFEVSTEISGFHLDVHSTMLRKVHQAAWLSRVTGWNGLVLTFSGLNNTREMYIRGEGIELPPTAIRWQVMPATLISLCLQTFAYSINPVSEALVTKMLCWRGGLLWT